MYFTDAGPKSGPLLAPHDPAALAVLRAPGDRSPIGSAVLAGSTDGGIALWKLTVRGAEIPGRWIVLGREFRPQRSGDHRGRRWRLVRPPIFRLAPGQELSQGPESAPSQAAAPSGQRPRAESADVGHAVASVPGDSRAPSLAPELRGVALGEVPHS
jgi:hypothetical protein